MVHLLRVVVPNHVVGEDDVPLPGEVDGARRDGCLVGVHQPTAVEVTVRREDGREGTGLPDRTVEIAGDEEVRMALEVDLLDAGPLALHASEDLRAERRPRRHGPEAGGEEDLPPQTVRVALPPLPRRVGGEVVDGVDPAHGEEAHVAVRQLPVLQLLAAIDAELRGADDGRAALRQGGAGGRGEGGERRREREDPSIGEHAGRVWRRGTGRSGGMSRMIASGARACQRRTRGPRSEFADDRSRGERRCSV